MSSHALDNALELDRRNVLVRGIYAAFGLICAGLGAPVVPYLLSPPKSTPKTPWVKVGSLGDFAPGSPQPVTFRLNRTDGWRTGGEETSAWVVNQGAGRIAAFSSACTHLGCLYRWRETTHEFFCPCHGSRFAMDGAVLNGPASRSLDRYEVRVEGGRLWLRPRVVRS